MLSFVEWLREAGLERYESVFADSDIDFSVVRKLTEYDLKELGLTLGHRKKFLDALADLDSHEPILAQSPVPSPSPATGGERRQLTVMFCDLVGSTALSERLDPEELRALLHAYRMKCGEVIARYEGHIARYVGDGILTYFGWPKAHEEDAERSIRSALEIIGAVKDIPAPESLSVRIGIATGPVVVGEQAGEGAEAKLAVGSTPNLAARLQGLAGTDQIVIAESTRKLVGNAFELSDLGTQTLKGIGDPVRPWRVTGIAEAKGRFQAAQAVEHLTPLVGRKEEIALLLRRWEQAKDAEGQVVLISGEAGIGKSRIVHALIERLKQDESIAQVQLQCSSFHANSSYHPLISHLERCAHFAPEDTSDHKLDKLQALLEQGRAVGGASATEAVPYVAEILGIPCGDRYPVAPLGAARQKEKTLEVLASHIVGTGQRLPVLLVLEDAQWADPSTLEAVDVIIERGHNARSLAVITYRPEFTHRWSNHPFVTQLPLGRLTRREAVAMVEQLAEILPLSLELLDEVVARTDGIPLFIEEVSRGLIESSLLAGRGEASGLALATLPIPATVQDALTARLDRLSVAKEIAQIGAAIGREFLHELVAAVSPLSAIELERALTQLIESGLVFRSGAGPQASYTFKHGLVQEVAYQSLLKARRQQLHRSIAEQIEQRFPHVATTQPEQLASHYFRAGLAEQAAGLWLRAGALAKTRLALSEAIHHARSGLEAIGDPGHGGALAADTRIDLLTLLGDLESLLSLLDDANRHYREAAGLAVEAQRRRSIENKLHHPKSVVRGGARVAYHEHGVGDDAILFVNPIAYALGTFQPLVERLCQEFRLISVNCRGTGASDPLVRPYRISDHVEDVRAIIEALGEPVIGVGISRGSTLLVKIAVQYPTLIKKLMLIGASVCDLVGRDNPFPPPKNYRRQRRALYAQEDIDALVRLHTAHAFSEPVTNHMREQAIRTVLALSRETILSFFDPDPELDIRAVLPQIAVPTLVAHGTDDLMVPLANGQYISERVPDAQLYTFEGKGHLPMVTAIDEFCGLLRQFVRSGAVGSQSESGFNALACTQAPPGI